jgi:hypothetical protein
MTGRPSAILPHPGRILQGHDPAVGGEAVLLGRPVAERAGGAHPIVVAPPVLDRGPGVGEADEPMAVQALDAEPPVEALDEGVLDGLARLAAVAELAASGRMRGRSGRLDPRFRG